MQTNQLHMMPLTSRGSTQGPQSGGKTEGKGGENPPNGMDGVIFSLDCHGSMAQ